MIFSAFLKLWPSRLHIFIVWSIEHEISLSCLRLVFDKCTYFFKAKGSNGVIMGVELVNSSACQETEQINVVVKTGERKAIKSANRRRCTDACLAHKKALLRRRIVWVPHLDESVSWRRNKLLIFAGRIKSDLVFHVEVNGGDFLLMGSFNYLLLVGAKLGQ